MNDDKSKKTGVGQEHFEERSREDAAKMSPLDPDMNATKKDDQGEDATKEHKELKHSSAASIDAIISSPTDAVRSRRHHDNLGNTGNNTSYEGATSNAPGGTGYNSGQPATGESINTTDAYDEAGIGHRKRQEEKNKDNEDEEKDII